MKKKILILRHAPADANIKGVLMGSSLAFNSPLSAEGQTIAAQKGKSLMTNSFSPGLIYASKLARARQTAEILLEELGSSVSIIEDERFNERGFGEHEGRPYSSVIEAFDKYGENPPTVEDTDEFVRRVIEAFEEVRDRTLDTTLIVTHSNPVMVIQMYAQNPANIRRFWELGDPNYCEGFLYEF